MRIHALRNAPLTKPSNSRSRTSTRAHSSGNRVPRHLVIGLLLVFALLTFELFNFDTTRFALQSLLGDVRFATLTWASILAIAFCAIDFAGLAKFFTPERGGDEPKEVWYLMGAWFLGATMNAVMTWWAVSLTLLDSQLGNEILTREQMIRYVPIFVAALVWLTRILFIGALSVTGERLLYGRNRPARSRAASRRRKNSLPRRAPVFSGVQGSTVPSLTPQPVDLAAATAESKTRGTIRRPSKPLTSYPQPTAASSMQASGHGHSVQS
jgi:hypothetical protein